MLRRHDRLPHVLLENASVPSAHQTCSFVLLLIIINQAHMCTILQEKLTERSSECCQP